MIRRCAEGRAVVFSSHLMQEVEALCTRIAILRQGRLVEDAALGQAQAALQLQLALPLARHAALQAALSACPGVRGVDAIEGEGGVSKWRISWETSRGATGAAAGTASDTAASHATCDAVLRIVLAHAEVRAVLSLHDAVETRLLAALAPNDPLLRRRA